MVQRDEGIVVALRGGQKIGGQRGGRVTERSKRSMWKKEQFERRFYRSEVDEEEFEAVIFDFRRLSRFFRGWDGEGDEDEREALDFRRFYRSGIGDFAKRPPALMRFCRRPSLSR